MSADSNEKQRWNFSAEECSRHPLMETREAAQLLGVSIRTLARLAGQGKIPGAVKVGKLWRFNRRKLYDFIGLEA